MILLKNVFDIIRSEFCLVVVRIRVVGNTGNLKVRLGHQEASIFNLKGVNVVRVFHIVVDYRQV